MRKPGLILLLFLNCLLLKSQKKEVYQFSGLVFDETSKESLEFVNIILNNRKGTITDKIGRFSFLVHPNDTLVFSSVGYKRDTLTISDTIKSSFINYEVYLKRDTIAIEQVIILPWATYEDFKEAFVQLELPDDDLERARHNIALIKTQAILDDSPDAYISYRNTMKEQYEKNFTYGMYPTISLLNPFAWAKFFEALRNGDFKNKNKN